MDEFDIIDLVYNHVEKSNPGMAIYKDRAKKGEDNNHIVISGMEYHELSWRNTMPVNVNIYVKQHHKSGMPNRTVLRSVKQKVRKELLKLKPKKGVFKDLKIESARNLYGVKENFDCINIKVIINTEKNIEEYGK